MASDQQAADQKLVEQSNAVGMSGPVTYCLVSTTFNQCLDSAVTYIVVFIRFKHYYHYSSIMGYVLPGFIHRSSASTLQMPVKLSIGFRIFSSRTRVRASSDQRRNHQIRYGPCHMFLFWVKDIGLLSVLLKMLHLMGWHLKVPQSVINQIWRLENIATTASTLWQIH